MSVGSLLDLLECQRNVVSNFQGNKKHLMCFLLRLGTTEPSAQGPSEQGAISLNRKRQVWSTNTTKYLVGVLLFVKTRAR